MNLYIIGTPLHLYNACERICSSSNNAENALIFISDVAYKHVSMAVLLQREGYKIKIFDFHNLNSNGCNLIPKIILKKIFLEKIFRLHSRLGGIENEEVEDIVVYTPNAFSMYLKYLFPDASVVIGEDGLGTYTGSAYDRLFYLDNADSKKSSIQKKILGKLNKVFFSGSLSLLPKKVMLHSPLLNCCDQPAPIEEIIRSERWSDLFCKYLDANAKRHTIIHDYRQYDCVFLGMPADNEKEVQLNDRLLESIKKCNFQIAYRKHPRERGFVEDGDQDVWELRCAREITDSSIIISAFSTAAVIPKVYYGIEPFLIFFYPILEKESGLKLNNVEALIDKISELYSDQEKVIAVNSVSELMECLRRLKKTKIV